MKKRILIFSLIASIAGSAPVVINKNLSLQPLFVNYTNVQTGTPTPVSVNMNLVIQKVYQDTGVTWPQSVTTNLTVPWPVTGAGIKAAYIAQIPTPTPTPIVIPVTPTPGE